jgi:hypothetical protein
MKQSFTIIIGLLLLQNLTSCRSHQKDSIFIKYISSRDFGEEMSQMTIQKTDSLWTAELKEDGKNDKKIHLSLSQKKAINKFISDLRGLSRTRNGGCTTIDFYELKVDNETIKKEDACGYWMGYKFLRQKIFPNRN